MLDRVKLYGLISRIFLSFAVVSAPSCLIIDAPFGRSLKSGTTFTLDGKIGWMVMEIVSPLTFIYSLTSSFSPAALVSKLSTLPAARSILAVAFLGHYLHRAIISSLRNPSRGRMHLSVFLSAIIFNLMNGFLMGSSIEGLVGLTKIEQRNYGIEPGFTLLYFAGIALFLLGFAGNVASDEILYNLRRNRPAVPSSAPVSERYSIPHGFLYDYISFPNYFTEWIEWSGFAIATLALSNPSPNAFYASIENLPGYLQPMRAWWCQPIFLFIINEIAAMLPRAISGHQWYRKNFKDFPLDRKVVIPWIF